MPFQMHRLFLPCVASGLLIASVSLPVQAASFDCRRAVYPDEVAVCRHPGLSQLDTEMGALWYSYSKVPYAMGANGERQDGAHAFLQRRSACGSDVACLRQVYRDRIRELKSNISQAMYNTGRSIGLYGP